MNSKISDHVLLFTGFLTQIGGYWKFYATLNIAIFGWLTYFNIDLHVLLKVLLTIVYLFFAFMNYRAIIESYVALDQITKEIQYEAEKLRNGEEHYYEWIKGFSFTDRILLARLLHFMFDLCIVLVIWIPVQLAQILSAT